jgi:hypothetical protein
MGISPLMWLVISQRFPVNDPMFLTSCQPQDCKNIQAENKGMAVFGPLEL